MGKLAANDKIDRKIYVFEKKVDPNFYDKVKFGQNCLFCLYRAQMSGERLHDYWSSGIFNFVS